MTALVLMPSHDDPAWGAFAAALCEALGSELPGRCTGELSVTRHLLAERGFNVEASVALYEQRGGYCDCEVIFNVDGALHDQVTCKA